MTEPTKLNQNATEPTRGTIYQLWVAVQKCYEMFEDGQKVLIETQGDVTTVDDEQVEVKHYTDALTDNHPCFWKTLYNWMQDNFNHKPYNSLILYTTQKFGPQATIADWNDKNPDDRLNTIKKILFYSEKRYNVSIIATTKGKKKPPLPEPLKYQQFVLDHIRQKKLNEVIGKFFIEASSPRLPELYKKIKGQRLQSILEGKRDDFLNALFGFITKPDLELGQSWVIRYEDFCTKVTDLTETYRKGTRIFPSVTIPKLNDQQLQEHDKHLFIQKILDIKHHEAVPEAVNDYLVAIKTVREEFKNYSVPVPRTDKYTRDIVRRFRTQFRQHSLNCSKVIKDSKIFYDAVMLDTPLGFEGFDITCSEFRNGLLHSEMDDETKNLKWRLEQDE
ncbi:MAG: hypothetical protein KAT56_08945 [Sedimentisphaerales bacterium]|nr:hypothetical protein [Sedimentisphaerales bacterium]